VKASNRYKRPPKNYIRSQHPCCYPKTYLETVKSPFNKADGNRTKMSASLELHPQSKRNKPTPTPTAPLSPVAMSRMSQSTELDEYTASMRSYLASIENGASAKRKRAADHEPNRSTGRGESVGGGGREKSPEFRWMDLASLRKEHANMSHSLPAGSETRVSKSVAKSVNHHHHAGKDARQHHRDHRPASPVGKAMSSKRHPVHAGAKSTEKN
jgi:hypothetical protein